VYVPIMPSREAVRNESIGAFCKEMPMPALLTHDCFSQDILCSLDARYRERPDGRPCTPTVRQALQDAFRLGNQGPDPFFYTLRTPRFLAAKRFGSRMHHENIQETMEAFRRLANSCPEPVGDLLWAYLLGFVCHFTLDSVAHPLVISQQNAFCDAGVKGLDRRDASVVHSQIEADIDMMMLRRRHANGIRDYDYTRDVLRADSSTLALLDAAYQALAHEVYAVDLLPNAFSGAVRDMRLSIRVLYSPRGIKRSALGRIERLFSRHSLAQALSPRAEVGEVCDFDNREHELWTNPFTGELSHASFDELYERALLQARENIAALVDGAPATTITHNLDFEGAPPVSEVSGG
jgi:hypothetical protein